MLLSDLLGATVTDAQGRRLGKVRDVRLVQDGPIQGTFGAGLRVQGLIVGKMAVASRLGYDRTSVNAPWAVATIVRWFDRDSWFVPWEQVHRVASHHIELDCEAVALTRPIPLPLLPGGPS